MNRLEREFMERMDTENVFTPKTLLTPDEKKKLFELLFEIRDFYRKAEERRKR